MASKLVVIAMVAIVLPSVAMAAEYIVGDDNGWTKDFDYDGWAKDKVFNVGDALVFKFQPGKHSVFKVNGTAFKDCTKPPANESLTTGNDVVTLATPGKKWYICGVGDHCANHKQKLVITVLASGAPAPTPMPSTPPPTAPSPNSAYGISGSAFKVVMGVMVLVASLAV